VEQAGPTGRSVHFGVFDLDLTTGELRKSGLKIRLPHQSFRILARLVEHPGDPASRDELRRILWPDDTFVDFDVGLSSAVKKLRDALGDSAENPRFIETLPRLGYRFIAPVHGPAGSVESAPPADALPIDVETPTWRSVIAAHVTRWHPLVLVLAGVTLVGLVWITALALASAGDQRSGSAHSSIGTIAVTPQRHALLTTAVSAEANELLFKATVSAGRSDFDGFKQAISYADAAIVKQPDFARAYAREAIWYNQFSFVGGLSPLEFMPKAEDAAHKAIALDEKIPEAHAALGLVLYRFRWDWSGAERELRRSLELNRNSADGHRMLGAFLSATGNSKKGVDEAQLAANLDLLSAQALLNLGTAHREAGQNELAISEFRKVLATRNDLPRAHFQLGVSYATQGDWDAAITELQTAVTLSRRNPRFLAWLGYADAMIGNRVKARNTLNELELLSRRQFVPPVDLAGLHIGLGEREAAFASLEKACEVRDHELTQLLVDSRMDTLRSDSRFQDLVRRIGLVR
jgi:DNA-binding winged helix-turn-helix (wHTH) protein/tetratricopeptide (TPR) repeat protein